MEPHSQIQTNLKYFAGGRSVKPTPPERCVSTHKLPVAMQE